MARKKQERKPLPPIWRVPDELWAIAEPIIAELDPPNRWVRSGWQPGRSWTRSSIAVELAVSGTGCLRSTRTTARSTGRSSAGSRLGCLNSSGRS